MSIFINIDIYCHENKVFSHGRTRPDTDNLYTSLGEASSIISGSYENRLQLQVAVAFRANKRLRRWRL